MKRTMKAGALAFVLALLVAGAALAATYRVEMQTGETLVVKGLGCTVAFHQQSPDTLEVACHGAGGTTPPTVAPPTDVPPTEAPPTEIPPTAVPPTAVPPTPGPGAIAPYPNAPVCPESLHNVNQWHRHWNEQAGCYYDHHHGGRAANVNGQYVVSTGAGASPTSLDYIFGMQLWAMMGGNTIGYPHMTPGENDRHFKHEAFVWFVWDDTGGPCYSANTDGCIRAGRVLAHVDHHNIASLRHSFYAEYLVCAEAAPDVCGIARFGGLTNMGDMFLDEQRIIDVAPPAKRMQAVQRLHYSNPSSNWYGGAESGFGPIATEVNDTFLVFQRPANAPVTDAAIVQASGQFVAGCAPDGDGFIPYGGPGGSRCPDQSRVQAHFFGLQFPGYWRGTVDPDRNGVADWSGYITPMGDVNASCAAAGPECVPASFEGVPMGVLYQYNGPRTEYSQTPAGAPHSWIRYHYYQHQH